MRLKMVRLNISAPAFGREALVCSYSMGVDGVEAIELSGSVIVVRGPPDVSAIVLPLACAQYGLLVPEARAVVPLAKIEQRRSR